MSATLLAALCAGGCVLALGRPRPRLPTAARPAREESDRLRSLAPVWCLCAAGAMLAFVPGPLRWIIAPGVAFALWLLLSRAESAQDRRRRAAMAEQLPALVQLLGAAVAAGAPVPRAVEVARQALPGAASDALTTVVVRLELGMDPVGVWRRCGEETPELAPLARTMVRTHESGVAVVATILDLADTLAADRRAHVEDRARSVGVRAAVPLGVCLLPAFLLIGIVPLVASAVQGLW